MTMDVLRSLTYELVRQYVGDTFQIRIEGGPTIDLKLEEVILLMEKHLNPRMKRDAFAMHFRGPSEPRLGQSTFPIHHEKLGGPLHIFLVPIGASAGFLYEAIFN
jgi:hypothetical protein